MQGLEEESAKRDTYKNDIRSSAKRSAKSCRAGEERATSPMHILRGANAANLLQDQSKNAARAKRFAYQVIQTLCEPPKGV